MADPTLRLAGNRLTLDPAGGLWIAGSRTLIVSDLHLEKASSHARRRTFLPPYDSRATLLALSHVIARRDPRRVICLGDSFHDRGGPERIGAEAGLLTAMQAGREWIWITGNHDPELPAALGGEITDLYELDGLVFRHEPAGGRPDGAMAEIAGHLHPAVRVVRHGRSVRRPAFVADGRRIILPAFGFLTGGLNVLDRAVLRHFSGGGFRAFALGRRRIFRIAPASLLPD